MKKVITLLFLLSAGVSLKAQTLARYAPSGNPDQAQTSVSPMYRQVYSAPMHITKFVIPGEKKKKIGSTMTVLGGALIVGGIAVYASSDPNYERTTYNSTTGAYETQTIDPKRVLGVFMMVAGTGVAVPGVLLWTKGARQYNRYMAEQGQTSLRFGIGNHGAGLAYSF